MSVHQGESQMMTNKRICNLRKNITTALAGIDYSQPNVSPVGNTRNQSIFVKR